MTFKCGECGRDQKLAYLSNKGVTVCETCSWWWLGDEAKNVLIDPSTIQITKDQWEKMGRHYGFLPKLPAEEKNRPFYVLTAEKSRRAKAWLMAILRPAGDLPKKENPE